MTISQGSVSRQSMAKMHPIPFSDTALLVGAGHQDTVNISRRDCTPDAKIHGPTDAQTVNLLNSTGMMRLYYQSLDLDRKPLSNHTCPSSATVGEIDRATHYVYTGHRGSEPCNPSNLLPIAGSII
jgi:hypothetical protein